MRTVARTAVTGRFNYINPSRAPSSPEIPLNSSLGLCFDEGLYLSKEKTVKNGREHNFNLKDDGFELICNVSLHLPYTQYSDKSKRFFVARNVFGALANRLVEERLGINSVFAWHFVPPLVRIASPDTIANTPEHSLGTRPHSMVHNDYGFDFLNYLKGLSPDDIYIKDKVKAAKMSEDYQCAGRAIVIQFWLSAQPEGTVIENDTLALCHPRSIQVSDLVTRPLLQYAGNKYKDNTVILQAKDSPRHEWFYWPALKTGDECLCWIGYDSARPEMWPCFHSSFHDPMVPSTSHKRESLECRVILLLDQKLKAKL